MGRNAAILAHFDPENRLDANVATLLHALERTFDRIVLVSTSPIDAEALRGFRRVELIVRPNIGYDFYSYRVGLDRLWQDADADKVLLINTSIVILDQSKFADALLKLMEARSRAAGITLSHQFGKHLQSYMLLLDSDVIATPWFRAFVDGIEPLGDKMEIIQRYEIGLSETLARNGAKLTALYAPTPDEVRVAETQWQDWQRSHAGTGGHSDPAPRAEPPNRGKGKGGGAATPSERKSSTTGQYNPLQFHAEAIARRFGFVKSEVLRDNPHDLDLSFVREMAGVDRLRQIEAVVERDRARYVPATLGKLSTVDAARSSIPSARLATWGTPHARGVRVAAVVHVYFPDVLEELMATLGNIVEPFDLYFTTPHEQLVPTLLRRGVATANSVTVALTENRGRDIGPFMRLHRDGLLDNYLAVLKLHTKKSRYSDKGDAWRRGLLGDLAGTSLTVRRVLTLFETGDVGIIGPQNDYLTDPAFWGSNRERLEGILAACAAGGAGDFPPLGFFAGSMFWFAPKAFDPLKTIPEAQLEFEPEVGQQDGTVAHALERVFAPLARSQGFVTTSVSLGGKEIADIDTSGNRVPVL